MEIGVCYYPEHWPESLWKSDAKEMKAIGISIVRIGEFAWSKLEPREGEFHFEWLDRALDILWREGLKVILGTPSATPPSWVLNKFPDLLAYDIEGRPREFGSRRHYCFSHEGYKELAAAMTERLAQRYGKHKALMAWQIDNEYGCHDTTRSYSPVAEKAFQNWLEKKYETISELNKRWGNVFWSMEYNNFDQIKLPNLTVTEPNPIHTLDFYRFSSDQVVEWNFTQVSALRRHSALQVMHNFMGRITDFDHFKVGRDLDFVTWDSYPMGFLEDRSDRSEEFKHDHQFCGDPDFQAFHHDLYRSAGNGRWAVMEQQPGPVNWAPYNPAPHPGIVRLWSFEAMAHGAEFVAFFRWRQLPFAQEQMHSALKLSDDTAGLCYEEIESLISETKGKYTEKPSNKVALIFDYESQWAWEVQPQGKEFDYFKLIFEFYCAFRNLGIAVDIISPKENIHKYALVCVPGMFTLSKTLISEFRNFNGELILGPRCHTKTIDFKLNLESVSELFNKKLKLVQVETLRPTTTKSFDGVGEFKIWLETLQIEDQSIPPLLQETNKTYICGWPTDHTLLNIIAAALDKASIAYEKLPAHIRKYGNYTFEYKTGKVTAQD